MKERDKIKNWYNGYLSEDGKLGIYNPWSIIISIKSNKIANYWEKSGAIANVSKIF